MAMSAIPAPAKMSGSGPVTGSVGAGAPVLTAGEVVTGGVVAGSVVVAGGVVGGAVVHGGDVVVHGGVVHVYVHGTSVASVGVTGGPDGWGSEQQCLTAAERTRFMPTPTARARTRFD